VAAIDLEGKVAVVTGGASGVGKALCDRFARERMKLVVADVEKRALDEAVADLSANGAEAIGVQTDVRRRDQVEALAEQAYSSFGAVHVVCNNAGVGTDETRLRIWESPENDWRWCFEVNVWGVLNGIQTFVPRMLEAGHEGRIVNTSSGNGGLYPLPTTAIYPTTKAAVVTMTEVLHHQLKMAGSQLTAGVLFPGPHIVNTGIFRAARNRPSELPQQIENAPAPPTLEDIKQMAKGMGHDLQVTEPEEVADYAVPMIRDGVFWILPDSEDADAKLQARAQSIVARTEPPLPFP
jgi:NAD(P)-dependent dehydrogenase (short-subunit alcohol dehydrogenase family)